MAEPSLTPSVPTQTRFSFYHASDAPASEETEVRVEAPAPEEDSVRPPAESAAATEPPTTLGPQRFQFYRAPSLDSPTAGCASWQPQEPVEHLSLEPARHDCDDETTPALHDSSSLPEDASHPDGLESQRESPERYHPGQKSHSATNRAPSHHQNTSYTSHNPYEDAIREALELLRRHRQPSSPTPPDPRLSARRSPTTTPSSAADMEARRQQRQQRMAQYASRLAELKKERPNSRSPPHHMPPNHHENQHDSQEQDHIQLPPHTRPRSTSDDASVPAGVERVLLAILERAGSRGRPMGQERTQASPQPHMETHASWTRGEEKKSVEDENALLLAVSDLLGASSMSSSQPQLGSQRSDDFDPVTASRSMDSVEYEVPGSIGEELVMVPDPDESEEDTPPLLGPIILSRTTVTHVDTDSEAVEAVATMDSSLEVEPQPSAHGSDHDELDELVRKFSSATSTSTAQKHVVTHPIEERVRQILSSDSSSCHRDGLDRRRKTYSEGERYQESEPLSEQEDHHGSLSSDAEGEEVSELERSYEDGEDDQPDSSVDRVLGPLAKSNTTTGVVLEPDSPGPANGMFETISAVMSLVTGEPPVSPTSTEATEDRYVEADESSSSEDSSVSSASNESSASDDCSFAEANELMRSLCAHLLPVGVDQTCRLLDPLPEWDSSNPDEPGYRIVRLRRAQLQRVEREYDLMIEKLRRHSERDLSRLGEELGSDAVFERDLKAAEDILDQEEKRYLDSRATTSVVNRGMESVAADSIICRSKLDSGIERGPPLAAFPGIKSAGNGDMGDLEFFHLPVIFKSHVTGFEPTKDLHLEAGNIVAGQYLVEGELGSAAFSTAYRCIDLSSEGSGPDGHQEVCLKVIKNTKDFFDQSLDEIKILELLRQTGMCHEKCIVEMKTFFYYREHLIIVTELLRQNLFEFGKFITDHNEEPYFTMLRLSYITRQCLIALEYVHSLGLVHSDVKPENILLGSYSRAKVKLIDFGSSCYLTDRQSSYIQSRSYRAPEVILGLPYDGRIDMWSLGCVVAEMYTGEVTFQNDSIVSMLSRIEAICGPFPRHMIAQGRQSGRFFTKCGLLFERVAGAGDESSRSETDESIRDQFDVFQPKMTNLAARLGFRPTLMDDFDSGRILPPEQNAQAIFVDFVRKVLTIDPESRLTARGALQHPWMQYASTLTEEDIKYPPPK